MQCLFPTSSVIEWNFPVSSLLKCVKYLGWEPSKPPNLSLRPNTQHTAALQLAHNTTLLKHSYPSTPTSKLQYWYPILQYQYQQADTYTL